MKTQTRPSTGIISVTINTADGRRTVSTETVDPKMAREILQAANVRGVEVLAKAGKLTQNLIHKLTIGGRKTVEECVAEWEQWLRATTSSEATVENYILYARAWARESKVIQRRICDIQEGHISEWVNQKDGTKLGSRRVKLGAIRSLFRFCSIREYCADISRLVKIKANLLSHEQKEPRRKTCFTDEEFNRLVAHIKSTLGQLLVDWPEDRMRPPEIEARIQTLRFWHAATLIGRYAGLRLGDICSLEWSCFNTKGKMIVWTDKRDKRVELDIDDNLFRGIATIPTNKKRFCFPEQDNIIRDRRRRCKLSVQFMRLLDGAEVKSHSFHDLRHTYATECQRKGISMPHISERLGHSHEETTEGYIHVTDICPYPR